VTGQGGGHQIEGVGLAGAVGGGVGEGPDELQLLDDRARPAVGDDQRQRVAMAGADVEEVDVEAVELGHELGQDVQPGLEFAPVVDRRPGAGQVLHGGQRHPLGVVVDRLTLGPPGRIDPPAQPLQVLLSNTHPKRTDRGILGRCAWLGRTWAGPGALRHRRSPSWVQGQPMGIRRSSGTLLQLRCRHGVGGPPSLVRAGRRSHPPLASATGQSRPSREITASWAVSSPLVSMVRLRVVPPRRGWSPVWRRVWGTRGPAGRDAVRRSDPMTNRQR